jgi:hypothetical protein
MERKKENMRKNNDENTNISLERGLLVHCREDRHVKRHIYSINENKNFA